MGGPIRILHVVVNMNRGGAETLLMNLYRNIDRSKIQFDFLTCKEGVFDQEIRELGGNVHRIPYVTDVGHFKYQKELKKFFFSNPQYKIVHSHMDKMSGFVLAAACGAGVPVRIAHSHSTRSEGGVLGRSYKWFAGNMIDKYATNWLACSKESSEWLYKNKSENVLILKNGIHSVKYQFSQSKRTEIRAEWGLEENAFVLGHVGRFSSPKNHYFLLEILKDVLSINPKVVMVLAGDGELLPDVKRKAEELQLTNKIKFLGSRNDVEKVLQGFDLFLFPSLFEGFPVSVIEAQGSGLPCLISDTITRSVDMGGELINFLPLTSRNEWLQKIIMFMRNGYSRNQNAYRFIVKNGYDIQNTSNQIVSFYTTLTG